MYAIILTSDLLQTTCVLFEEHLPSVVVLFTVLHRVDDCSSDNLITISFQNLVDVNRIDIAMFNIPCTVIRTDVFTTGSFLGFNTNHETFQI